jgi:hypothetical protein
LEGILGSDNPEISISHPNNRNPDNRNPNTCNPDNRNTDNRNTYHRNPDIRNPDNRNPNINPIKLNPDNRNMENRNPNNCNIRNPNNNDTDISLNGSMIPTHNGAITSSLTDKPLDYKPFIDENSEIIISYIKPTDNNGESNINHEQKYGQINPQQGGGQQGVKSHTYSGMDFKQNADFY